MNTTDDNEYTRYRERLTESGWLDALSAGERQRLEARLTARAGRLFETFYYALAPVILGPEDLEPAEVDEGGVCSLILGHLAAASHEVFLPVNLQERYDHERELIDFSFQHGGRRFRAVLDREEDSLLEPVLDLANEAVAGAGHAARFIIMPCDENVAPIVFIPVAVYRKAEEMGLIPPPGDDWDRLPGEPAEEE